MNVGHDPVLIVGGGPVGMTLAWRLERAGVSVRLFEAETELPDQLRASTFHPPTLDLFDEAGISAELIERGRITPTWQIRLHETSRRAEFDLGILSGDTAHPYRLQCRQAELTRALLRRLSDSVVLFGHRVETVRQDNAGVTVSCGDTETRGSYLIGCDGAHSLVREAMGASFDGGTYPQTTILATTHFPFEDHLDGLSGVNYIWKGSGTYSLLRLPDLWRISLTPPRGQADEISLSDDWIREQSRDIVAAAADLDIVEKRAYRIHHRIASAYRHGRLFIAGDAAHLNSPKGGMGMNGGIHDAWNLADKLIAVLSDGADPAILSAYDSQRRSIARDDIIAQADSNQKRMSRSDPAYREAELTALQTIAADPVKAKAFLLRSSMIEGLRRERTLQ